jgi:hypothetical protein
MGARQPADLLPETAPAVRAPRISAYGLAMTAYPSDQSLASGVTLLARWGVIGL